MTYPELDLDMNDETHVELIFVCIKRNIMSHPIFPSALRVSMHKNEVKFKEQPYTTKTHPKNLKEVLLLLD